jgi:hypothetical protein
VYGTSHHGSTAHGADREQYEQAIDGANRAIQERLDHQDAILTARLLERTGSSEAEASTMKECGG